MPVTEIASARLQPGSELGNPENQTAIAFKEALDTVSKQDGCQKIYFGTRTESPDILDLVVEWDDLAAHQKFMTQSYYEPFVDDFIGLTTGRAEFSLFHVNFEPEGSLVKALSAPVTSISTFHFANGGPPSSYGSSAQKFFDSLDVKPEGFKGYSMGHSVEELESEGGKAKGVVLIVGWDSLEARKAYYESAIAKENSQHLAQGVSKAEVHTVQFMQFIPA